MGSLFSLTLPINLVALLSLSWWNIIHSQGFDAAQLLDHVVRDHAFLSYTGHTKTGSLYLVNLPENFSDIKADTVRFRCGSLRRYGAQIKEFNLEMGLTVRPCVERVIVIRQNLGSNWSSIYYDSFNFSGYQLVSPVLGLLAYNADDDLNSSNRSEIGIFAGEKPIMIDFSRDVRIKAPPGLNPLCASLNSDGTVSLSEQVKENVCITPRDGHFALVIAPTMPKMKGRVSRWKVLVGSIIGGGLGVFLLFLLLIALVVKVKKRSRIAEMERRAYEEEALQMSMVGHVRAPTATVTRTVPTLEHGYAPP
ncbi:uncharacterized protein LOC122082709 [Macadamia integrifolia]|uniref:uncharacterized protein LOC122082709 n=1 Tax=Macadamia integrifolia TaxID=60698 RepID=UPI001C4EA69E|nr:uncharacterized protein LOC122082709 [Macadamia integrifolia]